jgi:hypothetical protein
MLGWNHGRCLPPLPDKEVVTIVVNVFERERAKHKWLTIPIGKTCCIMTSAIGTRARTSRRRRP